FVVAEQNVRAAAGGLRFLFEAPGEVEHFPRVLATIHHVADLDEVRGAAGPMAGRIDDVRGPKNFLIAIECAVDVSDGDHTIDVVELARARRIEPPREQGERDKRRSDGSSAGFQACRAGCHGTGVIGVRPLRTASTLSAARSAIAVRVSVVALPRCGSNSTLSSFSRSGWIAGSFS